MKRNPKWLISLVAATALSFSAVSLPAHADPGTCVVTSNADSGANTLRDCLSKIGTTGFLGGVDITFAPAGITISLDTPLVVNADEDPTEGMSVNITGLVTIMPSGSFAAGEADRLLEINITGRGNLDFDEVNFWNAPHGALVVNATNQVEFYMSDSNLSGNRTLVGSDHPEGAAVLASAPYANLWFDGNTFTSNSAYSHGGAIYSDSVAGMTNVTDDFTNNASLGNGGAIAATYRVVTGNTGPYNSTPSFTNNLASGNGGAIYSGALTQTMYTAFTDNTAGTNGGAIYSGTEYVQIDWSEFSGNDATSGRGGAVYQAAGYGALASSHFENNTAALDGGAMYFHNDAASETLIFQSSFFGNSATAGDGGGFFTNHSLKIGHNTFSSNVAGSEGGGLYAGTGAIIAFATMLGNSADTSPDVHIASGAGTSIGSVYASLTPSDTGSRFNAITGAYPGNFSTGLEGAFTTSGNYQGVTLASLELPSYSQFTTRRYDFFYVEFVTVNTTKGYVPATTSPLVGKVSNEAWAAFRLEGWDYVFANDQAADTFIETGPYTSGSINLFSDGDGGGGDGDGGGGDESGDVTTDPPTTPNLSITSVSKNTITGSGDSFVVYGRGLGDVTKLMIGDTEVVFSVNPDGSLRVTSPVLAYGQYDLKAISPDGQAVLLKALWVVDTLQFSTWTQRSGDSIKVYAKNVIGVGKVQFFVDGREIAWVNSVDSTDPKLRTAKGFHYLVRTVDLKLDGAKTRFEVKLNGERVRRNTYTINGN